MNQSGCLIACIICILPKIRLKTMWVISWIKWLVRSPAGRCRQARAKISADDASSMHTDPRWSSLLLLPSFPSQNVVFVDRVWHCWCCRRHMRLYINSHLWWDCSFAWCEVSICDQASMCLFVSLKALHLPPVIASDPLELSCSWLKEDKLMTLVRMLLRSLSSWHSLLNPPLIELMSFSYGMIINGKKIKHVTNIFSMLWNGHMCIFIWYYSAIGVIISSGMMGITQYILFANYVHLILYMYSKVGKQYSYKLVRERN
jgi:hypothetical protein